MLAAVFEAGHVELIFQVVLVETGFGFLGNFLGHLPGLAENVDLAAGELAQVGPFFGALGFVAIVLDLDIADLAVFANGDVGNGLADAIEVMAVTVCQDFVAILGQELLNFEIKQHVSIRHVAGERVQFAGTRFFVGEHNVGSLLLLLVVVLARFVGGRVAEFIGAGYGWLLGLFSAIVVGAAAGLAVHKTLGRWVKG